MEIEQKCAIWKNEAEVEHGDLVFEFDSPMAGGKYQISDQFASAVLRISFTDEQKSKLTDWLIEQREKGVEMPYVDMDVLQNAQARLKKTIPDRTKSFMLYLVRKYEVGEFIDISDDEAKMMLMAHSSSLTYKEMLGWLRECESQGYLREMSPGAYCLEVAGIRYVEGIGKENEQKRQCFVAMWFDKSMDNVYEQAIEPAILDAGYEPYRVDKDHHIERIDEKIITQIRQSGFIIADFTSEEEKPRGGVYYEAGFAHGLGLDVIWTCREDRIGGVHLDTRQYNHILWNDDNLQDFYDRIYLTIEKTIGNNENTKEQGTSFVGYKPY